MKQKKPIKKISKNQSKKNAILSKIKLKLKDENPLCACGGCSRDGTDLAHLLPKGGLYANHYTAEWNLVLMCRACHQKFDDFLWYRKEQKHLAERVAENDPKGAYGYYEFEMQK